MERIEKGGAVMNTVFKSIRRSWLVLVFIALASCGGGGGGDAVVGAKGGNHGGNGNHGGGKTKPLSFSNGQAAAVVVGQADFVTGNFGAGATGLSGAFSSVHVSNGNMYLSDDFNDRVLVFAGIPSANGASAAYALGQPDLTTVGGDGVSVATLNGPGGPVVSGGRLFVSEFNNHRVSIYNTLPTGSPGTIDVVLGQVDKITGVPGACDAIGMSTPEAVWAVGSKIIVPDGDHNRVLI